jgi:hypothetical protein
MRKRLHLAHFDRVAHEREVGENHKFQACHRPSNRIRPVLVVFELLLADNVDQKAEALLAHSKVVAKLAHVSRVLEIPLRRP